MYQVQKTLYLTLNGVYLSVQGDCIVVRQEDVEKLRVPACNIEEIIIFGNCTITNYIVRFCNDNRIRLFYVSVYGKYYGSITGETAGNILLKREQYKLYDNEKKSLALVKNIVLGKSLNMSMNITRSIYDMDNIEKKAILNNTKNKIHENISKLDECDNIDSVRGIEGIVSKYYFDVFDEMLKTDDEKMLFKERSRRPPENNCNALLSLLYTLFGINCTSGLETFGLDSFCGYLHRMRPGRRSLSLDLLEEFRSYIVDRFVITLINRKQITSNDFEKDEDGIHLTDKGLKTTLKLWEEYKNKEIDFKLYNKKVPIKVIPFLQAQLLAKFIRGDINEYPPFVWSI